MPKQLPSANVQTRAKREFLSDLLTEYLHQSGITQAELARRCELWLVRNSPNGEHSFPRYLITNYLSRRSTPRGWKLKALAAEMGIAESELSPPPNKTTHSFEKLPHGGYRVRIEGEVSAKTAARIMELMAEEEA